MLHNASMLLPYLKYSNKIYYWSYSNDMTMTDVYKHNHRLKNIGFFPIPTCIQQPPVLLQFSFKKKPAAASRHFK